MLDIFSSIKNFLRADRTFATSPVLWLHSRLTAALLIAFCLILAARQFVGNPIECDSKAVPNSVLDTWCWIHHTYSVRGSFAKEAGVEVPYPGVDKARGKQSTKTYRFYQWVAFCLFFQVQTFLYGQELVMYFSLINHISINLA